MNRYLGVALLIAGCGTSSELPSFRDRLAALGATPCDFDPELVCGAIDVPVDHTAAGGPTQPFAFAARVADDPAPLGTLVSVEGGPGFSGIDFHDDWSSVDPALRARFDLLTFDLRGVVRSTSLDCPEASSAWYSTAPRGATASEQQALVASAQVYASACPREAGFDAAALATYSTAQAVEDLEVLRVALQLDDLTIYGLSYGTQLTQAYTHAHVDHVRAVVLDGVIDLTVTDRQFATSLNDSANAVLDRVLAACAADAGCAGDLGDPAAAYDAIATQLDAAAVTFPRPHGGTRSRTFTRGDLDALTTFAVGDQDGRSALLRALAAARVHADFGPLRRLLDDLGGIDPETDRYVVDGFSDAVYYTFTANDYGRPANGASDYVAGAAPILAAKPRSITDYFGDLPVSIWPGAPAELPRPPAFAPGIPVLLVTADADVATPARQGDAVLAALRAAGNPVLGVAVSGGHHVMVGDNACTDATTTAFLLDPVAATSGTPGDVRCDAGLIARYVPLSFAAAPHVARRRPHRAGSR
jgi:pimeloyl-ACP methyl ester carboxylesterase